MPYYLITQIQHVEAVVFVENREEASTYAEAIVADLETLDQYGERYPIFGPENGNPLVDFEAWTVTGETQIVECDENGNPL